MLTIPFLTLPAVAIADIYFCKSTHGTLLGYNEGEPISVGSENDSYSITVDTTRGYRTQMSVPGEPPAGAADYGGSCTASDNLLDPSQGQTINCKEGFGGEIPWEDFSLFKSEVTIFPDLNFWYVNILGVNVISIQGLCEKA